ncbi:hypothetical protein Ciccas_014056 [Cichlidogyrus casuarinus]|uniref:C-type lectin domain-containing protein n=1 Tax=Cichlidogyrus casuarinus TaxID=1844966 RepID=A0ABD2PKF9_9PLAT
MIRTSVILIAILAGLVSCQESTTSTIGSSSSTTITVGETTLSPMQTASAEDNTDQVFSRLVIANKRATEHWGLTNDEAEKVCQDMVKKIHNETDSDSEDVRTLVDRILNDHNVDGGIEAVNITAHLLSIHSIEEYNLLGSFLARLPGDVYWTGGKLTRYVNNNRKTNKQTTSLILTWSDGTTSDPYSLGIDETRAKELAEGKVYCLAFNTINGQWQARSCDDRLPYACILAHGHEDSTTVSALDAVDASSTVSGQTTTQIPSTTTSA